jgi:hypothetical protein
MPVVWADTLKAVHERRWTINDAWNLIESSSAINSKLHPEVHVLFPEMHADSDKHFIFQTDSKGVEYRDRGRHSTFRNAWEAAGAVCTALNSEAGERALKLVAKGPVILLSRSALIGAPVQLERLQLEYKGKTTGVSYFEKSCDYVFLFLMLSPPYLALKTAYPAAGGAGAPPAGMDVVKQDKTVTTFLARK